MLINWGNNVSHYIHGRTLNTFSRELSQEIVIVFYWSNKYYLNVNGTYKLSSDLRLEEILK